MELARQYPRQAEAVGNVAELAGIKGSGRLFGDAMNTLAENLPTRLEGFTDLQMWLVNYRQSLVLL